MNDVDTKRESGFDTSLRGEQTWPPRMFSVRKLTVDGLQGAEDVANSVSVKVVHLTDGVQEQ